MSRGMNIVFAAALLLGVTGAACNGDETDDPCDPSLDLEPISLADGFCVVHRFPLTATPDAFNVNGDTVWTYSLDKSATPIKGTVSQWSLDPETGALGSPSSFFSCSAGTTDAADKVFASTFLPRSPGGLLAVGYSDSSFTGEVFWSDEGVKPKQVAKASNYDVVFLDDKTLLINGTGVGEVAEGQGVYVVQEGQQPWRLVKDLGEASGHLALGDSVLFAGGAFGASFENRIYGFTLDEVTEAITNKTTLTPDGDGDLILKAGMIPDAVAVGDSLVAGPADPATFQFKEIQQIKVTVSGKTISVASKDLVATPAAGLNIAQLSGSDSKLALMLGGGSKLEIAVIRAK